jgi:cytochrome c oxidase accessory protein FixG
MTSRDDSTSGTTREEVVSFYAKHEKIHPREVTGRFSSLRKLAVFILLGLFYLVPWLSWDGRQAVLFDLPARKFYIWGLVLWPQDFIFLTWLLILLGLSLFFFTALAGRLWCGYACPQTVWTEVFLWTERWIEGDRNKRLKLQKSPWNRGKLFKKSSKHFVWIVFSFWTGVSFVGFFVPMGSLVESISHADVNGWPLFWTLFYGGATYANAGFMREQVCKYMCPYARFQSAMFDRDTLIITYDQKRGEPRGARARSSDRSQQSLGDCVDCTVCVQVCPTGIDIRKGLQYECIACAACVDACDSVMDKVGYPRGLIRYTTQHALDGRQTKVLRGRTYVYATLLSLIFVGGVVALVNRKTADLDVIRDRNALYRETGHDEIENVYLLRVLNKRMTPRTFNLTVEGLGSARIDGGIPHWQLAGGEVYTTAVRVEVPGDTIHGGHTLRFVLTDDATGQRLLAEKARFIAPP